MTYVGSCETTQSNIISALVWVVKALGMRSYKNLDSWVEKVCTMYCVLY